MSSYATILFLFTLFQIEFACISIIPKAIIDTAYIYVTYDAKQMTSKFSNNAGRSKITCPTFLSTLKSLALPSYPQLKYCKKFHRHCQAIVFVLLWSVSAPSPSPHAVWEYNSGELSTEVSINLIVPKLFAKSANERIIESQSSAASSTFIHQPDYQTHSMQARYVVGTKTKIVTT